MTRLETYGMDTDIYPVGSESDGLIPGRVTELRRDHYTVVTERGEITAVLKGAFIYDAVFREDLPCVGDFVLIQYNENGSSLICSLLPRRSKFSRSDYYGHSLAHVKANREQIVAVNFDYVFILTSLNWDFKINRIMRYLTQALNSGGLPVILLTKADLAEDFGGLLEDVRNAAPGVPVHAVSAQTGYGLDALEEYLSPGKTVVFLGMSGVGKSSLLNALMDREVMAVREIREDDSRGRHTTTHRQLFMLPSGAMVIDTPGMRELGLLDADKGVSAGFSEVESLFALCRFSDCRHISEPGCAVLAALDDGALEPKQWERYQTQKNEIKFIDDRTSYMREKQAFHKSLAMSTRRRNKHKRS